MTENSIASFAPTSDSFVKRRVPRGISILPEELISPKLPSST
jgi:hypothetical protein